MNVLRKAVSALGGIFLAALLIAALAPKATHGLVAALVQVTNTSSNPAATLDNAHAAPWIVDLVCAAAPAGGNTGSCGPGGAAFTVPGGLALVITSMEFTPATPGAGVYAPQLITTTGGVNSDRGEQYYLPCASTTQLQFPSSGIVIGPNQELSFNNLKGSACGIYLINIHGYETAF